LVIIILLSPWSHEEQRAKDEFGQLSCSRHGGYFQKVQSCVDVTDFCAKYCDVGRWVAMRSASSGRECFKFENADPANQNVSSGNLSEVRHCLICWDPDDHHGLLRPSTLEPTVRTRCTSTPPFHTCHGYYIIPHWDWKWRQRVQECSLLVYRQKTTPSRRITEQRWRRRKSGIGRMAVRLSPSGKLGTIPDAFQEHGAGPRGAK
jgi:hypothetical protein